MHNAMSEGIWPYNADYAPGPDYTCPVCGDPENGEDVLYEIGNQYICGECFDSYIASLPKTDLADALGITVTKAEDEK